MINFDKHRYFMVQILKDIYSDATLASLLGFKGGTALMLFHDLKRFSVDLDFNLLDVSKIDFVYEVLRKIIGRYGQIKDQAVKHFGLLIVLAYESGERNLKIEVSQRQQDDHYEVRSYLGIPIKVMILADMFAHKLAAVLDRKNLTTRDLYDIRYFLQKRIPLNKELLEQRTGLALSAYLDKLISFVEALPKNKILQGLGDLLNEEAKQETKQNLLKDVVFLLKLFKENPLVRIGPRG